MTFHLNSYFGRPAKGPAHVRASLLLAVAAGALSATGALSADLGVKKPAAADYVKTCPTYGAGFFVVPGTTSCLKLIGRVRFEYAFDDIRHSRRSDKNTLVARGYLGFDHRTQTEYGLLRTYVRAFFNRANAANNVALEYAYIQFGGLTVGRVDPVFDTGFTGAFFASDGITTNAVGGISDISYINSIGYTANLSNKFTATIALDSSKERTMGVAGGQAGQAMPEIVGALTYADSWGEAKLSGALHQVRSLATNVATKYGYAGQLGVKLNLPGLHSGTYVWAAASLSEGATNYTGWNATQVGDVVITPRDSVFSTASSQALTKSWGVAGGFYAPITPTVYVAAMGTYGQMDPYGARNTVKAASLTGNIGWRPVAGFLIGTELVYRTVQLNRVTYALPAGASRNDFSGRLRFQRDF